MATQYLLAINPQWAFLDLLGDLANGGKIYSWRSANHSVPKALYQDPEGQNTWPNPLDLSAIGVPEDGGVSYPIYYADDEPYFIQIKAANGDVIFQVDDYPKPTSGTPVVTETETYNYIINGQFRRWPKQSYESPVDNIPLLAYGNWSFAKNNTSATDTISFEEFNVGQIDVPENPKYYFNYTCTGPGTSETQKDLIVTFEDVNTFANQVMNFQLYGMSPQASSVEILLIQNFGTGGSPSAQNVQPITTFNLTSTETNYTTIFTVDDIAGKTLGDNGDDNVQFIIRMPFNAIANVNITNVALKMGDQITDYQEEDQAHNASNILGTIVPIPSPEQAYQKLVVASNGSYQLINSAGEEFVTWRQGTIPGALDENGASYWADDYPLLYAALLPTGATNGIAQFGTGADAFISYAFSAIAAGYFEIACNTAGAVTAAVDNNTGFTFTSLSPGSAVALQGFSTPTPAIAEFWTLARGTMGAATAGTTSFTMNVIQTGNRATFGVFQLSFVAGSSVTGGHYWKFGTPSINYYVWYKVNGAGSDPAPGGTGILVSILSTDTAAQVKFKTMAAVSGTAGFGITALAGSSSLAGKYFLATSPTTEFYVWYTVDDVGIDPAIANKTGIEVDIASTDTANDVANKTTAAINAVQFRVPFVNGLFSRAMDNGSNVDPNAATRMQTYPGTAAGDNIGSMQTDTVGPHDHSLETLPPYRPGENLGPYKDETDHNTGSGLEETELSIGDETRPINIYKRYMIRYA